MTMDNFQLEYHDRATPEAAIAAVMGAMIVGAECGLTPSETITLLPNRQHHRDQWGAHAMLRVEREPATEDEDEEEDEEAEEAAALDRYQFQQLLEFAARVGVGVIGRAEPGDDLLGIDPIFDLIEDDKKGDDAESLLLLWDVIALVNRSKFIIFDAVRDLEPDAQEVIIPLDRVVVGKFPSWMPLTDRLAFAGLHALSLHKVNPGTTTAPLANQRAQAAELLRYLDLLSVVFGITRDALYRLRESGRAAIKKTLARDDLEPHERDALSPDSEVGNIQTEILAGLLLEPDSEHPFKRFWGGLRLVAVMIYSGEADTRIRARISQAETMEALHGITRCHDLPAGFQQWDAYRFPKIFFPETPR